MENNYEYIISACLCGEKCRYDGKASQYDNIKKLVDDKKAIMVCPEILGGLPVPRPQCEIKNDKVIDINGDDKTINFVKGAEETLRIAQKYNIKKAILKEKSPSCGSKYIYDGSFNRKLIEGQGVTAKLLRENGIEVIDEGEFDLIML